MSIQFWNRRKQKLETESVYGGAFVNFLYGNSLGYALTDSLLVRKFISQWYGSLQSAPRSSRKIEKFVKNFSVDMSEFEAGPFGSFNEFFIRKFLPGRRPFPSDDKVMGAPAEARYLGYRNVDSPLEIPVKGLALDALSVLGGTKEKELFRGGPCLLARLCPVDYHRFHYPDDGRTLHVHSETGKLHSVNPAALRRRPDLFLTNERQISILQTKNFGRLAYVEVGALCVGKIVQSHPIEKSFWRGEEKGYFLFGGSTVILYGEKGAWEPAEDVVKNTAEGMETLVELGSPIARATSR